MKKVLFVMHNLTGGGAEKVLVDILDNIDKSKFNITLLLLEKKGIYLENIPEQIKVISIKDKLKIVPIKIITKLIKYFPRVLYSIVVKERYDTEIAFMEGLVTNFVGNSTNKDSRKIAWIHADLFKQHWTKNMFLPKKEKECYDKFNEIVFVSNGAKNAFSKLFPMNQVNKRVIYNPIISSSIIEKSNEKFIRYEDLTIISVGRLNHQKGYDRLIKIHSELVEEYPHKLLILGEGEERNKLERIIDELGVNKTVELKGFVKNPYPYVKAADLFVSSSRSEAYALVVAESLVLGKAIISTNTTGPRELLENGKYGILCEDSCEDIKNSIKSVLINKSLLQKYSDLAVKRANFLEYRFIINEIEKVI